MQPSILFPAALLLSGAYAIVSPRNYQAPLQLRSSSANATCKCFPGDDCWPSEAQWSSLNITVRGRLIQTVPLGSPCHDPYFDEKECAYLQGSWTVPSLHINSSSSVTAPFFANQSCDPFTPREQPCTLGNYVHYAVNATGPDDITAAINFAKERNVRLVIRNTAHDYLGRSTGAGALAVWTHNLKDITPISWNDANFTGIALKLGAGIQGFELLKAAGALGRVAVTGECPTVGVVGGYTQGGGHSALSTNFGLAADQTLEMEVVTAFGELLTVSKTENADLYWALNGGGPGNYGVVVSMTVKTYANTVTSGAKLLVSKAANGNSTETVWKAVDAFHATLTDLVDFGTMVIYYFATDYLQISALTAFNKTQAELETAMTPLLTSLKSLDLTYTVNYTEHPTYQDHYDYFCGPLPDGWIEVGTSLFGGRLIGRDHLITSAFSAACRSVAESGATFIGVGTSVGAFGGDNAVLPAWRDAIVSASLTVPFSFTDSWAEVYEKQDLITYTIDPIMEVATPGSGTYMNEADFRQLNWKEVFFGVNYDKLLAIKDKYDPEGVFYCDVAVGSDRWRVAVDGQMCKTR